MKHKKELLCALLCTVLVGVLLFVVGMRAGLHDAQAISEEEHEKVIAEIEKGYKAQILALEDELIKEQRLEHVVIDYKPMPVDYATVPETAVHETDAVLIAKTLWGEARGCSTEQQKACAWCVLNRLDTGKWGNTVKSVVTAPGQFHGYCSGNPLDADLYAVAVDVLTRYKAEDVCIGSIGRTLQKDFIYFEADGNGRNVFRTEYGERIVP